MRKVCRNFYQKRFSKILKKFREIFSFFRFLVSKYFFIFIWYGMKMKKYFETQNRKNLKIFEIWKMKIFPENLQIFWKCFLIKISANFAHDDASSLYPISRDEFRTTVTIFRFAQNVRQIKKPIIILVFERPKSSSRTPPRLATVDFPSEIPPHVLHSKSKISQYNLAEIKKSTKYTHGVAEKPHDMPITFHGTWPNLFC